MINKRRLGDIVEIRNALQEWQRSDAALDFYVRKLNRFADEFPAKEKELKEILAAKDIDKLAECACAIRDMLFDIRADDLAIAHEGKIKEFKTMDTVTLEAYVERFLSTVSALSIDIQLAVNASDDGEAEAAVSGGEPREMTILAVDDNAFFLNSLKSAMQNSSHKLACVTSGKVALRFLEKNTPDLFILDIEMPEMNGYELARNIRAAGQRAPIIFLTGNASKEYVRKAVEVGAADFIIKPLNKDQILSKIGKYL